MSTRDRVVYSRSFGRAALAPLARWGYRRHQRTGVTPGPAYSAMRKLYGGASSAPFDALVSRAARDRPVLDLGPADGLAAAEVDRAVAGLRADGYVVLDARLDDASCAELAATAQAASCRTIGADGRIGRGRFDPRHPRAVRADLDEADILACPAAQRLVSDRSLLAIAQAYLGAAPVQDLVAMWWSAAVDTDEAAADAAAQRYHFDLDRLRFVKVFAYLTDVGPQQGPHVYVRGSHRSKPAALRHDGRHGDAEVAAAFPGEERPITGPRGTVFLADTLGLHKGLPVVDGHRLVFQTEYATSLFGSSWSQAPVTDPEPELAQAMAALPSVFARFSAR